MRKNKNRAIQFPATYSDALILQHFCRTEKSRFFFFTVEVENYIQVPQSQTVIFALAHWQTRFDHESSVNTVLTVRRWMSLQLSYCFWEIRDSTLLGFSLVFHPPLQRSDQRINLWRSQRPTDCPILPRLYSIRQRRIPDWKISKLLWIAELLLLLITIIFISVIVFLDEIVPLPNGFRRCIKWEYVFVP